MNKAFDLVTIHARVRIFAIVTMLLESTVVDGAQRVEPYPGIRSLSKKGIFMCCMHAACDKGMLAFTAVAC